MQPPFGGPPSSAPRTLLSGAATTNTPPSGGGRVVLLIVLGVLGLFAMLGGVLVVLLVLYKPRSTEAATPLNAPHGSGDAPVIAPVASGTAPGVVSTATAATAVHRAPTPSGAHPFSSAGAAAPLQSVTGTPPPSAIATTRAVTTATAPPAPTSTSKELRVLKIVYVRAFGAYDDNAATAIVTPKKADLERCFDQNYNAETVDFSVTYDVAVDGAGHVTQVTCAYTSYNKKLLACAAAVLGPLFFGPPKPGALHPMAIHFRYDST